MDSKKKAVSKKADTKNTKIAEKKGSKEIKDTTTSSGEEHERVISQVAETFGDKGFNDEDISKIIPSLTKEDRVSLVNKMISKGILDVFVSQAGTIVYKKKLFDSSLDPALKGADTEEKVVYGIIKEAGNKGIWMRDIRFKCNLLPTQLNKVLKSLENKKIIKAVKSVSAHKKKVYMLYNLEPDSTLTGGSWYTGEDFESEFVDILNQQCYRFLLELKQNKDNKSKNKGPLAALNSVSSTPKEVRKFITELKISNVPLSEDDIKTILDTLVYDGKVERKIIPGNNEYSYRAVESLVKAEGVAVVPCGVCPVIHRCHENSFVTSIKCPYLQEWGKKTS